MRKLGFVLMALLCMSLAIPALAAEKGEISFGLNGGLAMPMGDFGDVAKMGFGGGVYADYWLMPAIAIGVDGSYNRFDYSDDYITLDEALLHEVDPAGTVDGTFTLMQFGAHGKYMFPLENAPVAPWLSIGLGMYNMKDKYDVTSSVLDEAGLNPSDEISDTKFGVNGAIGAAFKVSPAFSVGASIGMHDIFTEGSSTQYFTAGITLGFSTAAQTAK
jgi:hypothetical protein